MAQRYALLRPPGSPGNATIAHKSRSRRVICFAGAAALDIELPSLKPEGLLHVTDTPAQFAVHCRNISKTYGAGVAMVAALRGVGLDVQRGELLILVGIGHPLYRFSFTHSPFLIYLTTADILVIVLTWHEFRYLRRHLARQS